MGISVERSGSFVPTRGRPVPLVAAVVWCAALVCAVTAVWLWVEGARLNREAERLEQHAAELSDEILWLETEAEGTPDADMLRVQVERIRFFNGLAGNRGPDLSQVMALLSRELAEDVWLGQLSYDSETGSLAFQLRAEDEVALPQALSRLEQIDALQGVILERQFRMRQGGRSLMQFDVRAEVRP